MEAFEDIVRRYLENKGYWVRQSVKVHISKEDKVTIGTYSMPTPEVDLVALNVRDNELLLIEAKSFLDSYGVCYKSVSDPTDKNARRYKLFTNNTFREIVTNQLKKQFIDQELINSDTKINYALAAGHIRNGDEQPIMDYFSSKGWQVFTPNQIKDYLKQLIDKGWENDLVTITAKLLRKK